MMFTHRAHLGLFCMVLHINYNIYTLYFIFYELYAIIVIGKNISYNVVFSVFTSFSTGVK